MLQDEVLQLRKKRVVDLQKATKAIRDGKHCMFVGAFVEQVGEGYKTTFIAYGAPHRLLKSIAVDVQNHLQLKAATENYDLNGEPLKSPNP